MRKNAAGVIRSNICSIFLQILALGVYFLDKRISVGVIVFNILFIFGNSLSLIKKNAKNRVCEKCGTEFPILHRVCPACGHITAKGNHEKEMAEVMKRQDINEVVNQFDELDRDFERVEQMTIEKALAYEEDDMESILMEKMLFDERSM